PHLQPGTYRRGHEVLGRTCLSCCGWGPSQGRPPGDSPTGVRSAQSLAGRTLEAEALTRELSAWLLICACMGAWVGAAVSVQGQGGGLGAGAVTCLNNNILRIHCRWSAPEPGRGPPTTRQAAGTDVSSGPGSASWCCPPRKCLYLPTTSPSRCTAASLGRSRSAWWTRSTCLGDMSNVTSHYCVLTWRVSPALEPLTAILSYELAFKKEEEGWEQAQLRDHIVGVTRLSLDAVEMDPGSRYEARLRVRMATPETDVEEELRYAGQWSEWSRSARFPSPPRPDQGPLSSSRGQPSSSTLVAVPVFLVLTSLTYLVFKLSPRWVGKVCVRVCVCVAVCVWGHLGPERPSLPPSALPAI
uniref:Interleukin 9 receptor n=1 Tax=Neovison vison TaxID=452646 RepID=A0A8C7BG38_NEOVI